MIPDDLADRLDATYRLHPRLRSEVTRLHLLQEALACNAYGTAALEGYRGSLEDVQRLLAPRFRQQLLELVRDHLRAAQGAQRR